MRMSRYLAAGAALVLTAGSAFAQGRPGGFGRGGFGGPFGGGGASGLLQMAEVQKELKIDAAQLDLIKQVQQEMGQKRQQLFQNFQSLSPDERRAQFQNPETRARMEAIGQETDKKVQEILDKKQWARLKQLEIQREGTRALTRKEVQDDLKLTGDQRSRIQAQQDSERDSFRQAFQSFNFQPGQEMTDQQRQEIRQKFEQLRQQNDARMLAILTDPQKKQFQAMQGAPFKFPEFGGFGGPRRRPQQ